MLTLHEEFNEALKGHTENARCIDGALRELDRVEDAATIAMVRANIATGYALRALALATMLGQGNIENAISKVAYAIEKHE